MSESNELERLRNMKADLEEQSHSFDEQQKNLEEKTNVLEERIAIRELENGNEAKRQAIVQLESKVECLGQKLKNVTEGSASAELRDGMNSEAAEALEAAEESALQNADVIEAESEDEIAEVAALEDSATAEQAEIAENPKRQSERKRRRLF
jgi:hypothetical protein